MQKLSLKIHRFRTLQTSSAIDFPFAVHPRMRFAQLNDAAPVFGLMKPFRPESAMDLEGFHPNIVAGAASELLRLAEQIDLGILNLSSVDHALIVLTQCGQPPLNDVVRVILWQAFGVPVFEISMGLDNSILGYECELHDGWHLPANVRFSELNGELMLDAQGVAGLHTALSGSMTEDACPCGRTGRRLLNMESVQPVDGCLRRAAIA